MERTAAESPNNAEKTEAPHEPHLHWEAPHATAVADIVPPRRKIAYGVGCLTDFFYANVVYAMAMPIFAIAMKMDPFKLGIALAATKIVGALTDPFVGTVSDNFKSPWGRRRPFILGGALVGAVMMPFLWMPPQHGVALGGFQIDASMVGFVYVTVMISVFSVFYSVFAVPYGALGFELTGDYDERTRVFAWKNYINMIGVFAGSWFYWFCMRPIFGNEIVGVRWLSVIGGCVMVFCAILVVRGSREKAEVRHTAYEKKTIPVFEALKRTFSNKPFLMVQAAALVVALGTGVDGPIGMYLHVHYTCAGNKDLASYIGGVGGTLATCSIFLALPLGVWLSTRLGKREASLIGMLIMLVSVLILPWVLTPAHPWWIVSAWLFSTVGMQCASLMFASMVADICDEDELDTGMRREGSYAAAGSFLSKTNQMIMLVIGGWLPRLAGYCDFSIDPTVPQLERMKALLIATQVVGVGASLVLLWFYPLTRARSEATRRQLDARRVAAG